MAKDESNKKSIWTKIGGAVKTGAGATKNVLLLVPKALIYPVKKPFASLDEMKYDAKVSLKEAVGIDVLEEEKKYDPPIETTEASKYLGIQITKQGKGKVSFLASITLTGDIPYLTSEQLDALEELNNTKISIQGKEDKYSRIAVFREENTIVIEVDVEKITNALKSSSGYKGKSSEEIKKLVIGEIFSEIDRNLKALEEITGGNFGKFHTDRKLLYGIANKLYSGYDSKKRQSQEVIRSMGKEKSSEKIWQKAIKQDSESCESIRGGRK